MNDWKEYFYYDENNYMIERLRQRWFISSWENDAKWFFFYDQNYLLVEELNLDWQNSNWENSSKTIYTYNLNNILVEMLLQYWWNSNWENSRKGTYTYDINNNNLIEVLVKRWDNSNWENYERSTYYHMPAGSEQTEHKRSNVNKAIEDFQTTEDNLVISSLEKADQTLSLTGVQVLIDSVLHTSDSDLEFTISHNGVSETIIYQAGGSGDNFIGTKLTDDGIDSISNGIAPFSGNYKPENLLSPFAGTDPTGTWTLSIYDGVAGNTGTLQAWGIVLIYSAAVGVDDELNVNPERFHLSQNYPNPFNPITKIRFTIPQDLRGETRDVTFKVYDVLGNEVATLMNEEKSAGDYEVEFNVSLLSGSVSAEGGYASGVYFYQLKAGSFIQTKKMLLIK